MDTQDLASLVPELMHGHSGHAWSMSSEGGAGSDLRFDIHPVGAPERIAAVVVFAGAEVYACNFEGHSSVEFAYEDADRREALESRIEFAVAATTGPTRVILELTGDRLISSQLILSPGDPDQRKDGPVSWPVRRFSARLRLRRIERKVTDYPALAHDS